MIPWIMGANLRGLAVPKEVEEAREGKPWVQERYLVRGKKGGRWEGQEVEWQREAGRVLQKGIRQNWS